MPVEHGPVDEEKPLLATRARPRGLARGCRPRRSNCAEAVPLREHPRTRGGRARPEGASRAEYDDEHGYPIPHERSSTKRSASVAVEDAAEAPDRRQGRSSPSVARISSHGARKTASVDQLGHDASPLELLDEARERSDPTDSAAGPSIARIRPSSRANASASGAEPDLDFAVRDRVAEDSGRRSRGRAKQEVERQRRAPGEVTDRRAARRSWGRSTRRTRNARRARGSSAAARRPRRAGRLARGPG